MQILGVSLNVKEIALAAIVGAVAVGALSYVVKKTASATADGAAGILAPNPNAPAADPDDTLGGMLYALGHNNDTNKPNFLGQIIDFWVL